jgi:hypothetical protein
LCHAGKLLPNRKLYAAALNGITAEPKRIKKLAEKEIYSETLCSSFCERRTRSTEYGARRLGSW